MNPVVATVLGAVLVVAILRDVFEAIILPQTVSRAWRPARVFYILTWGAWTRAAGAIPAGKQRQGFLAVYGPLSILVLFAFWAYCLIVGFALLQYGFGSHLDLVNGESNFWIDLYMSGTTFFTLGLGDVYPVSRIGPETTLGGVTRGLRSFNSDWTRPNTGGSMIIGTTTVMCSLSGFRVRDRES